MQVRRAMPMPQQAPQGNIYSDIGHAGRQTAQDVEVYSQEKQRQNQQKRMMDEMIRKRQLAAKVAQAKADMEQKEFEFKEAEEKTRAEEKDRSQLKDEAHEANIAGKIDKENEAKQNLRDFSKALYEDRKTKEADGKSLSEADAEELAEVYGVVGTTEADRIITRRFPHYRPNAPRRPSSASQSRDYKEEEARRAVAFRQAELEKIATRLNTITNSNIESSRMIRDPFSMESVIQKMPKESEQRRMAESLFKLLMKKTEQLNDAKITSGEEFKQGSPDVQSTVDELRRIQEENAALESQLGE